MLDSDEATIRALALDLGGVLLTDGTKTAFRILGDLPSSPPYEELERRWQQELRIPAELGDIDSETVFSTLAEWVQIPVTDVEGVMFGEFQPIPQGVSILKKAAALEIPTVLATNHLDSWLRQWEARYSWFELIDVLVCSSNLGTRKPERAFYEELYRAAGRPHDLLFVDDDALNVDGAQKCGIRSVLAVDDWSTTVEKWMKMPQL